jgi:hypothetical protein
VVEPLIAAPLVVGLILASALSGKAAATKAATANKSFIFIPVPQSSVMRIAFPPFREAGIVKRVEVTGSIWLVREAIHCS